LPYVVLFAIPASIARANPYCSIYTFVDVHPPRLRELFGLKWAAVGASERSRDIYG
jgi:hypothetical protein